MEEGEGRREGHRFFFPPFSSPPSTYFFSSVLCFFFFSLFFCAQYDAITGKNGKTFTTTTPTFYNYRFPRLPFRPGNRSRSFVPDPRPFFPRITPERSFVPSCTHDPRIQFTFQASTSRHRMEQRKFVADDHCVRAVDYGRIYGYNNERARNFHCFSFLLFSLSKE